MVTVDLRVARSSSCLCGISVFSLRLWLGRLNSGSASFEGGVLRRKEGRVLTEKDEPKPASQGRSRLRRTAWLRHRRSLLLDNPGGDVYIASS